MDIPGTEQNGYNAKRFYSIPNYEGRYVIDSFGNAISVERTVKIRDSFYRTIKSKKLKLTIGSHGYLTISLTKNSKTTNVCVHRILAEIYIPNPQNKPTVNHKDGNKINNALSNLEWNTYKENLNHAVVNNLRKIAIWKTKKSRKLNPTQVILIRNRFSNGEKKSVLAREYGVCHSTVADIVSFKNWKSIL